MGECWTVKNQPEKTTLKGENVIIREKFRVASFIKNRVYLLVRRVDQMKDKKLDRWKGRHAII
jgi:hypothetical protein